MTSRSPSPFTLAAALLAVAACAPGARQAGQASEAPTKPLFEVHPLEEIAGVKDPHDYKGKPLCQRCHFPDGKLTAAPNALCGECHTFAHGNHPVDVVQTKPAGGLPLLAGGKVACHTCHDPHQKGKVLRKPFNELCTSCHGVH